MADSSSDEEPTLQQLIGRHAAPDGRQGSQDSELPDWIQAHTPVKTAIDISSDSDSGLGGRPAAAVPAGRRDEAAGPGPSSTAAAAAAAVAAAGDRVAPGSSGKQAGRAGSSAAAAAAAAAAAGGAAAAAAAAAAGGRSSVQLIMPEKLLRHKVLVELEPAPHQATDLSGDAGAVGRLIVDRAAVDQGSFKLDLKGVLYQAQVLPLAGTALVVNIGPTEAKVESVLNDFVRLREEASYLESGLAAEGAAGMADLGVDDDGDDGGYLGPGAAGEDGKDDGDKSGRKKAAGKRGGKAGGAGKAAAGGRALKPAKAGVKKKPGRPKGSGAKGAKAGTPKKAKAATAGGGRKAAAGGKAAAGAKAAGSKAAAGAKAGGKAAAAAAKPAPKKKKPAHSDEEEGDWDSDWSGE